jgi:type III secretion system YscQ/HrcQ family protein
MEARPYPQERVRAVSRAEARALSRASRWLSGGDAAHWLPAGVMREARALLGAEVELTGGAPELWGAESLATALLEPLVAVVLAWPQGARDSVAVVEVTAELAASLVDRVLGGDGDVTASAGEPLDELARGVLGYFAARLAGESEGAVRVAAVLANAEEVGATIQNSLHEARVLVWPCTLRVAERTLGRVRVWVGDWPRLDRETFTVAGTRMLNAAGMGALPIALCVHAGRVTLASSELFSLAPGDVVLADTTRLARGERGWCGEVELHVMGARQATARCELDADALRIVGVEHRSMVPDEGRTMSEGKLAVEGEGSIGAALLRDAPIELCVELARFSVRLDELLALRAGEVWSTGQPVGAQVTLSVAGRPIARGELVELEGEVGVRIAERLDASEAPDAGR